MMTIMFITVIINFDNSHSKLLPLHHTLPLHHDDTMFIIKIIIFKINNDNMEQLFDNDKVVTNQNLSSINIKVQRIFKLR